MKLLPIIPVFCATLTTAKELLSQKGGGYDPDSLWCLGQCWQAGEKKCVGKKVHECIYKDMCWHEVAICSRACVTFPWAQCMGHAPKEGDGFPPVEVEVAPSVSPSEFDQGPEVSWDDDEGKIDWGHRG